MNAMRTQDELKALVGRAALAYVEPGSVVGVGTGSTVNFFIDALAEMKDRIPGAVASSEATKKRLEGHGIRVFDLNDVSEIPVYVDGADEVNARLHMITGAGHNLHASHADEFNRVLGAFIDEVVAIISVHVKKTVLTFANMAL